MKTKPFSQMNEEEKAHLRQCFLDSFNIQNVVSKSRARKMIKQTQAQQRAIRKEVKNDWKM